MKEKLDIVADKVQNVNKGINDLLIPILKDTIEDENKHNKRLFIINIALCVVLIIIVLTSLILLYRQNIRYNEFLSQFNFGSETIYQDLDTNTGTISESTLINN